MGAGRCGTCHFAPLFGGTVPPVFSDSEVEVLGVPADRLSRAVDADPGRFAVTRNPLHIHAFRTPSVRHIADTAPYMHNGVYSTLMEVIDFYDAGGAAGRGVDMPNQTLPPDSLHLTRVQKRQLEAFLKSLSRK